MKLLLDTHIFLWWRAEPSRLASDIQDAIATADLVYVSAASAWEAAIKVSLGKLRIPTTFEVGVVESGFEKLIIHFAHAEQSAKLPLHHKDPFDRMLIAQATLEGLTLVTHDKQFEAYAVPTLWV